RPVVRRDGRGAPARARAPGRPAGRAACRGADRAAGRGAGALRHRASRCTRGAHGRSRGAVPRKSARRGRSDPPRRLTPLLLALGASIAWGVADFTGPLIGRTFGALRILFWAQVGGVVAIAIAVALRGEAPRGPEVLFAVVAGICGTLGLYAYYRGVQVGAMSVVAPIAGLSAVIPVAFGVATGDSPKPWQAVGILAALAGVGLASVEHQEGTRRVAAGVGLALLA